MSLLDTLNFWVALGTVALQAAALFLLIVFFFRKQASFAPFARAVGKHGTWVSLVLVLAGTALSLVYSEYLGIVPCGLCWLQRIFLYPQAVIFAVGLFIKDRSAAVNSIILSLIGGAVALYQHYLQVGGAELIPCPASGGDCAKRFLFEFGYITFPLVAFSLFALLIVLMLFVRARSRAS